MGGHRLAKRDDKGDLWPSGDRGAWCLLGDMVVKVVVRSWCLDASLDSFPSSKEKVVSMVLLEKGGERVRMGANAAALRKKCGELWELMR
ncbi:hypothetical protein Tco_0060573 [Tanacetum coccineum]